MLTSQPYGSSVHGQAKAEAGRKVARWHDRYGSDRPTRRPSQPPGAAGGDGEDPRRLCGRAAPWRADGADGPAAATPRPGAGAWDAAGRDGRRPGLARRLVHQRPRQPTPPSTLAVTDGAQEQHGPRGSASSPPASATHRPAGHRRAGVFKDQADLRHPGTGGIDWPAEEARAEPGSARSAPPDRRINAVGATRASHFRPCATAHRPLRTGDGA
jgi:hypothetical protein